MKRLAVISTHPIQYYAPLFRLLSNSCELRVFYTWGEKSIQKFDPGFKREVIWDIPLLDGYEFEFLKNTSSNPGSSHFNGIKNPGGIEQVKKFKPDVILIFGWAYQSHLSFIRFFHKKVPLLFRGDSTLLDVCSKTSVKNVIRKLLLKWVYSHIDKAFYVGRNNKDYFLKYGLSQDQLIFAPHAVDNHRFDGDYTNEANGLRKALNIGEKQVVILFAGKLETKKDPSILLDAFSALNASSCHLLFVGTGDLTSALKFKVESEEIKNVHFLGFQNQLQMPVVYAASNIFCLPSKGPGETWGLAVNEAMAAGNAIVVSEKVGCAVNLVKPGYNGNIFRSGDVNDLTEKLLNLLAQDLLAFGLNSKKIIKHWTLKRCANTILNTLYSESR